MIDRRTFLTGLATAAVASQTGRLAASTSVSHRNHDNLIPDKPTTAPNYWCTWAVQNYMYGHQRKQLEPSILEGDSGAELARNAMSESALFSQEGWAKSFYPTVRKDLYLLLDDGWETGGTATFEPDEKKFPSFAGSSRERLRKLNDSICNAGWRSTALWCRNTPGGDADQHLEAISEFAGIPYWKVDGGDPNFHLTQLRNANHASLAIEHVHGESPVNGDWRKDGRFGAQPWGSRRQVILANTDVYRTYDVTSILSLPTTLDRVAEMLKGAELHAEIHALLNVEDEVYVAAVLGCTMGIMRHPLQGMRPGNDADLFLNGPRRIKGRLDEVVRALRWQRIAPPFSPGIGQVHISEDILTDNHLFQRGETWESDLIGMKVNQSAPACIARNIALPQVTAKGEKPFVIAAAFPNGAVAVAAQERTVNGKAWYMPSCEVKLSVSDNSGPFGIFGDFERLILTFDRPVSKRQILGQDLAGSQSVDITSSVQIQGRELTLPGNLIRQIGLHDATPGDLSSPGMVMVLR